MYLAIWRARFTELRRKLWRATVLRSGALTAFFLLAVLVAAVLIVKQRGTGHLTKIKAELAPKAAVPIAAPLLPGGQEPLVLQRFATEGGSMPEFLSATLLPGRGMNILQITASLRDKGEIKLLAGPPLDDAAKMKLMTGAGPDANGALSLQLGSAIEIPWAGRMGAPAQPEASRLALNWRGRTLSLPVYRDVPGELPGAFGGLLLNLPADSVKTNVMPDGGDAQLAFAAGDFHGHWLSHTDITSTVLLSSRVLEIGVTARNVGTEPEPMGIGWAPRFVIPGGDRDQVLLRLPSADREEMRSDGSGLPTGKLLPVAGTPYDFTARAGTPLGPLSLDENFVHLKSGLLDNGPITELRDPGSDFGLRITLLSPTIKAMRVNAPSGEKYISLQPQFNLDDPFGHEWPSTVDTGMVVLEPGQTVQWKVRIELFSLSSQMRGRL